MVNSLTRQAGFKLGPIVLETLVKHYFERILKDHDETDGVTQLRQDELLYDAAFTVVKSFLEAATKHTIEEVQGFSNTRTPSPPWVHVVRLLVPMSCCDAAAVALIRALGGEEHTKRVVGGTKWWQVRGVRGVDAEWITAKRDWQQAERRHRDRERTGETRKAQRNGETGTKGADGLKDAPDSYEPEMDEMPCILYAHGGGYYFGSVDQERYAIQRYARKISGRVFAINYRLAPQYPFPCAIQDLLAAYLFLIEPPPGALHRPVKPAHIVVAGDSAGGGLCIALLQVLRDTGLPLPAGGVLISPWSDLTHSFPSIHTNTATDVLPPSGLSFHKPSTLWPPPPDIITTKVRGSIRSRIRQAMHLGSSTSVPTESDPKDSCSPSAPSGDHIIPADASGRTLNVGSTTSIPAIDSAVRDQTVTLHTKNGEVLTIEDQIHMYTPNYLLSHPLVSPVVSYLGGLPPLLVVASDREVLRDEVIYMAHKAAFPDKYPVKEEARKIYPALEGIEQRFGPTKVHLQVYDDCAHVLPILFSFTTPAKYCYRAIATFTKHITGRVIIQPTIDLSLTSSPPSTPEVNTPDLSDVGEALETPPVTPSGSVHRHNSSPALQVQRSKQRSGMRRAFSASVTRTSLFRRQGEDSAHARDAPGSSDVAGNRFKETSSSETPQGVRKAGEPSVYSNGLDAMIRERVSTHGVIRPLEPEEELPALKLPLELIGVISELSMRRYMDQLAIHTKRFSKTSKVIEKARQKNLDRAKRDTLKNMAQLQTFIANEQDEHRKGGPADKDKGKGTFHGIKEGLATTGSWSWAWALDVDEHPPPSSIVARRDTEEARELAQIADQAVLADEHAMSANNLWSLIVDFLTLTPDRHKHEHEGRERDGRSPDSDTDKEKAENKSIFSRLVPERLKERHSEGHVP